MPVAQPEVEADQDLGAAHRLADRGLVDRDWSAARAVVDEVAGDRDPHRVRVHGGGLAGARPRRVGGEPRGLEDRAPRRRPRCPRRRRCGPSSASRPWTAALTSELAIDRPRDGARVGVVRGARDLAGDQRRGALAVARPAGGRGPGRRPRSRTPSAARAPASPVGVRGAGPPRGEQEHGVVGAACRRRPRAGSTSSAAAPAQERAQRRRRRRSRRSARTDSIVAIRGWIIPTPLRCRSR